MSKRWLLESELALRAASSSAEMIEERWSQDLAFKTKGSLRDIVTELDIDTERHIRGILETCGYPVIGEETYADSGIKIDLNGCTWFVDPIDGTTNLISSLPFYATSVGLVSGSTFSVGAVAMPALKEIFFTIAGRGAFMNSKTLKVSPSNLESSLIAAGFSGNYPDADKRRQEYELFGILNDNSRGCLRLGSAATNICYVACGRLKAAYAISNKIWDVAAGLAIALQAGCRVYVEWRAETAEINYVVGAPGVAEAIIEFGQLKKLASLKPVYLKNV